MIRILGIMTGTSCDGLDASCIKFNESGWAPIWFRSENYPKSLKLRVLELQKPGALTSILNLLEIQRDYSTWCAEVILKFTKSTPKNQAPDVLSIHGQTVAHFPKCFTTLQLIEPSIIANKTGLTVITNFREGDQAAGGQGAPLAPRFHLELFPNIKKHDRVVVHNLGGISNLTVIGPNKEFFAFDTGPANLWIDDAVRYYTDEKLQFDKNGNLAASGKSDPLIVDKILKMPFFDLPPPKSTGRDDFPFEMYVKHFKNPKSVNLITTAVEITAQSIARAYEDWVTTSKISTSYLCGGGARNTYLVERLQALVPKANFKSIETLGIEPEYIESSAFAHLGFISLYGGSVNGPWTGATGPAPSGRILPGKNWEKLLKSISKSKTFQKK